MTDAFTEQMVIEHTRIALDHLAPIILVDSVEAIAGKGLKGDRHFGNTARQVTIQSTEELLVASERLGRPIDPDLTRRNITIRAGLLPRVRGKRLVIGGATLEVFADAAPCELMEELNGPGARSALKRLAGIHCKVITSGPIRVGDVLRAGADQ